MSKLDIRDNAIEKVESLVFADDYSAYIASEIEFEDSGYGGPSLLMRDSDGDDGFRIRLADVKNFIKALEKAYELWGE